MHVSIRHHQSLHGWQVALSTRCVQRSLPLILCADLRLGPMVYEQLNYPVEAQLSG